MGAPWFLIVYGPCCEPHCALSRHGLPCLSAIIYNGPCRLSPQVSKSKIFGWTSINTSARSDRAWSTEEPCEIRNIMKHRHDRIADVLLESPKLRFVMTWKKQRDTLDSSSTVQVRTILPSVILRSVCTHVCFEYG